MSKNLHSKKASEGATETKIFGPLPIIFAVITYCPLENLEQLVMALTRFLTSHLSYGSQYLTLSV